MSILEVMKGLSLESRNSANSIVVEVQDKRTNVGKMVHEIRKDEKATDKKVKAFQVWYEKANQEMLDALKKIDTYIKAELIQQEGMDDDTYKAKREEYKLLRKNIRDAEGLASNQPGFTAELFADLPSILSFTTGKEVSDTSNTKRPHLDYITVNGVEAFTEKKDAKDGSVKRSYSFGAAAAAIYKDCKVRVPATDISQAAFETVGGDDLSVLNEIEYVFTVTDKKDVVHSYTIVAVPNGTESDDVEDEESVE